MDADSRVAHNPQYLDNRAKEEAKRIAKLQEQLVYCVEHESQLDNGERGFIDSISVQLDNKGYLTVKQEAKLLTIYTNVLEDNDYA